MLRERREDIPLLVQRFLSRSEKPVTIRQDALNRILSYNWPGNVRELENVIAAMHCVGSGRSATNSRRGGRHQMGLDQVPFREGRLGRDSQEVEGRLC